MTVNRVILRKIGSAGVTPISATVDHASKRNGGEDPLTRVTACLLSLGPDFDSNIVRLTALCGELLGATSAFYKRLENLSLCSVGQWHAPSGYTPEVKPEGHICFDVIREGREEPTLVRNLPQTIYATTDPNVAKYRLQTYFGRAVYCAGWPIACLSTVYKEDVEPEDQDAHILNILGAALSREEERKRAEEALRESERRLRGAVVNSPFPIMLHAEDGEVLLVSDAWTEISGYSQADIGTTDAWIELAFGQRKQLVEENIRRAYGLTERAKEGEYTVVTKFGEERTWDFMSASLGTLPDGRRTAISMATDITERKSAEDSLAKHAANIQALLDLQQLTHAPQREVVDFVLHAGMTITQSAYSFVGILDTPEMVRAVDHWSTDAMDDLPISVEPREFAVPAAGLWGNCIEQGKIIVCNDGYAARPGGKGSPDNSLAVHGYCAVPLLDGRRVVAVLAVGNKTRNYIQADVDALSELLNKMWGILSCQRAEQDGERFRAQFVQAQKMEAVGQLAGGVAHDFNNLLQVILGNAEMLRLHPERVPSVDRLNGIIKAAEYARDLTRQLLAFSQRQIMQPVNVDLNELIRGVLKMVRRIIGEQICLNFMPGEQLGIVYVDRVQVGQILMNLCVNARDAMPGGGTLTIETKNVAVGAEYCSRHPWATEGRYVLMIVTDTGHGMNESTRSQVFEPFFTTKGLGKGTGLGLAMVYGILKQHNGMIHVSSEPEKGTAFKVFIPTVNAAANVVEPNCAQLAIGGSETILLAEDDEMLRNVTVLMLENVGYTVLAACDGEEALRMFEEHAGKIELAILDVIMPKLGGREVMDRIQAQCARMRFLFTSGYSQSSIDRNFVIKEGMRLIPKPYRRADLLHALRDILDG